MASSLGERAWVFVMKSDDERSWAANLGYDDSAGVYYSYDSNVGNSRRVKTGDLIVVRQDDYVAGWGFIEHIEVTENAKKEIRRCPNCAKTNISFRKTMNPAFKCSSCKTEFSQPVSKLEPVTAFRAIYYNTWTEAVRPVFRTELEKFIESQDKSNAIRPLDPEKLGPFLDQISGRDVDIEIDVGDEQVALILGGHTETIVRRRRGQREFRFEMMRRFGEVCAFSGDQPPQVLEAAHINSFAATGKHHVDGGLLLRRDFHALFDANLMTVNPSTMNIEIAPRLETFETYKSFQGSGLYIPKNVEPDKKLLKVHYEQSMRVFEHN